jgi:hypothetical protein
MFVLRVIYTPGAARLIAGSRAMPFMQQDCLQAGK